jgi:homoserine acetyltransferase
LRKWYLRTSPYRCSRKLAVTGVALRRYGTEHFVRLALKRWGKISAEDLDNAIVVGHGLPIKDDADRGLVVGS